MRALLVLILGIVVIHPANVEDISNQLEREFQNNATLLRSSEGRDIVAFLGNTGSGKSTLVNYLAGKSLISLDDQGYELNDTEDQEAMPIGNRGEAETFYPKFIDLDNLRLFDLPGFCAGGGRGSIDRKGRHILESAFIKHILIKANSVRFVIVSGQDEMTALHGGLATEMIKSIKGLLHIPNNANIDHSVFILTKSTYILPSNHDNFLINIADNLAYWLIRRVEARDNVQLGQAIAYWRGANRLCYMFHPQHGGLSESNRKEIIDKIRNIPSRKITNVNVAFLYPADTENSLKQLFTNSINKSLNERLERLLPENTTLSKYDQVIESYQGDNFWQGLCRESQSISLIKELTPETYQEILQEIQKGNERRVTQYIEGLYTKKEDRTVDIKQKTETKAQEIVINLVPHHDKIMENEQELVFFDFAYHKDFYEQVCGIRNIDQLAADDLEKEIVRKTCANFILCRSHQQMKEWYQKFGHK